MSAPQSGYRIQAEYPASTDEAAFWEDSELRDAYFKYWQLRYSGQNDEAYKMEAPLFKEKVQPPLYKSYVRNTTKDELLKITLNRLDRENNIYTVDSQFKLKTLDDGEKMLHHVDQWVLVDGDWFHALRDPIFFRFDYGQTAN